MALMSMCSYPVFSQPASVRTSINLNRRLCKANMQTSSDNTPQSSSVNLISEEKNLKTGKQILACPICYEKMISRDETVSSQGSVSQSTYECNICKKAYIGKETHIDLTVLGASKNYDEVMPVSTEFFRLPIISYVYERGWRQAFSSGGFPGPDIEFELIKDYLKPVLGGNIVDASCGSGLFSRLFAKSELFSQVIALDYAENMLHQCYEYAKQEEDFPKEKLILVRADIARLPFESSSIDAVHAGAALHCWPSPSAAVAEISRVLRPGGVFVATTYIMDSSPTAFPFLNCLRQNMRRVTSGNLFLAEDELEELCSTCGLVDFTCTRNRQFVMISATKPS